MKPNLNLIISNHKSPAGISDICELFTDALKFNLKTSLLPDKSKVNLIIEDFSSKDFTNYLIIDTDCGGEANAILEQGFNSTNKILKYKNSKVCTINPMNCYILIIYCKNEMDIVNSLEAIEPCSITI